MTSPSSAATTNCGSNNDVRTSIKQNLPHRPCRSRLKKSKNSIQQNNCTMLSSFDVRTGLQYTWNIAVYMFAAIVLLNTVGLNSVARADTIQYPVTAPLGSGLIPPGKSISFWRNSKKEKKNKLSTIIMKITRFTFYHSPWPWWLFF